MKIAFIGFGEAARAFADTLRGGELSFSAYDILSAKGADGDVRNAASRFGVVVAESPRDAVRGADWVFSAVTAADSLDAAMSVQDALVPGQVFIDINSVSAGRKQATAKLVEGRGCAYVDMAVMAPVHPKGHRTPVLIAGPACADAEPRLKQLGFNCEIVGDEVGGATSIKMLRSLFVKGLEAITVQTLLAAKQAGRFDEVYASVSQSFAALGWPGFPLYQLDRVATHGVRRAAEMRESAATLDELGFPAGRDLANAIADLQQSVGELGWKKPAGNDPAIAYGALAEHLSRSS